MHNNLRARRQTSPWAQVSAHMHQQPAYYNASRKSAEMLEKSRHQNVITQISVNPLKYILKIVAPQKNNHMSCLAFRFIQFISFLFLLN
jgi:hypothetical protein